MGAGPAGMAAAIAAARSGARVVIIDDNPEIGGQIWRGVSAQPESEAAKWSEKLHRAGAEVLCSTRVFHQEPGVLFAEHTDECVAISFEKLILTTGAREQFLPFPGWTLPNVMGAGGLQALAKSGLPVAGKRVVIAGSGPLLLAVAAYLKKHGAEIPMICEQASWNSLARFGFGLWHEPQKMAQSVSLGFALRGIPFAPNSWPVRAIGQTRIEAVEISRNGKTKTIACEYLACGFHLVPNIEFPELLGCEIRDGCVVVDEFQRTSMPGVYCAGEPTGIGGLELALIEGEIAGLSAAGRTESATKRFGEREKLRHFAAVLAQTFRLRPELRSLPDTDTIVCRCEDATYGRLKEFTSWRAGKLHARCGMGPCQGRVCGPAIEFLFGWRPESVRPPIFPVTIGSLAGVALEPELQDTAVTGGK